MTDGVGPRTKVLTGEQGPGETRPRRVHFDAYTETYCLVRNVEGRPRPVVDRTPFLSRALRFLRALTIFAGGVF